MGTYDTLVDGEKLAQVKIFNRTMSVFKKGDKLPVEGLGVGNTFTIVLPDYEGARFAIVKDGKFIKLTSDVNETYRPYVDKWGNIIEKLEDMVNPFYQAVQEALKKEEMKNEGEI